jgi:hypothetical protein
MPRDRLVVGQRAHAEARHLGDVAQVDVEHAGAHAVERRRLVVGQRRAGLLAELRHALDLDADGGPQVEGGPRPASISSMMAW